MVHVGRLGVLFGCAAMVVACQRAPAGGSGSSGGGGTSAGASGTTTPGGTSSSSSSSSSSSGGSSSSDDSSSTGDDGGAFIGDMDVGYEPCDPIEQDCPEGEKCSGFITEPGYCCVDANKCVPIIGDVGFGEPCTRSEENDDCRKGLFCVAEKSGSTGEGTCLAYCGTEGVWGSCEYGGECLVYGDGILPLCWQRCDPLASICSPGEGCYFVPECAELLCALTDHPPGEGTDDDPCAAIQACEPGLICFDGALQNGCTADRCCTSACEVGNDADCVDPAESCVAMYEQGMAPPGLENLGYCGVG